MGIGFLGKLLGKPAALPANLAETVADLEKLAHDRPTLKGHCAVLSDILPELFNASIAEPPPELTAEQAGAKMGSGIPLLRGETVPVAGKTLRQRWLAICAAVARHQESGAAQALAKAVQQQKLDPAEWLAEILAGRAEEVAPQMDALGLDASLATTVLRLSAFPILAKISAALAPLRQQLPWEHGYCPTCGSWPLLGEFRGLDQSRFLRCGLCAAAWEFARLRCPFCDNRDHHVLGYFHVEGEEGRYRAATCDACHGYVKMVSTLAELSGPQLLVADLATLHLDLAAAERGFFVG